MKATYQPFILDIAEAVFEDLKDEFKPSDASKEYLCKLLTQKFIDGKLSEGDGVKGIFDTEEEVSIFINQCWVNDHLDSLKERGFIGSFDDDESFFITKEGKLYMEKMMGANYT